MDRVELVRSAGVVGSHRGEGSVLHHTWTLDALAPDAAQDGGVRAIETNLGRIIRLAPGEGWGRLEVTPTNTGSVTLVLDPTKKRPPRDDLAALRPG